MSTYSAVHQTAAGTGLPIINLTGGTTVRIALYDLIVGSDDTPADAAGEFVLNRSTTAGTGGTALTEQKLDPLTVNNATAAGVGGTFTTDPTSGNNLLMIGLHQRATFRWIAAPGGEIYTPQTANNGLMLECTAMSTGTPNINATLFWRE